MKRSLFAFSIATAFFLAACAPSSPVPEFTQPQGGSSSSVASAVSQDAGATYTIEQVAQHAAETDCYTAVDGGVYDITAYIPVHKGGKDKIMKICGRDGSSMFGRKHGQNQKAVNQLASMRIGTLAP